MIRILFESILEWPVIDQTHTPTGSTIFDTTEGEGLRTSKEKIFGCRLHQHFDTFSLNKRVYIVCSKKSNTSKERAETPLILSNSSYVLVSICVVGESQ